MTKRKFGREYETDAIRLGTDLGVAALQVARDLDLPESVRRRWMRAFSASLAAAFPRNG